MAQFTEYLSSDSGAPTITGQSGSLTTFLDAILVGSGGIAYGSKASAGWTIDYTGTNKRVYRPAAGNRLYLRVQDDAPTTAKEARVYGAESFTDVDTPVDRFPTAAQLSAGVIWRKSNTADATARAWAAYADDRTLILLIDTGDGLGYIGYYFGDIKSELASDGYRTAIIGRSVENSSSSNNGSLNHNPSTASVAAGHYMARNYTAATKSENIAPIFQHISPGTVFTTLNPENGGTYPVQKWIMASDIRGRYRGVWQTSNVDNATWVSKDTFSGVGNLSGKTFRYFLGASYVNHLLIETSNTLETD